MERIPARVRFDAKVKVTPSGCWEWTAYRNPKGYGTFKYERRDWLAHRWIYTEVKGEIPPGLELDHLCRNRACVNPDHLEPVTHEVNVRRGRAGEVNGERQRSQTHCARGHAYDEANTRWRLHRNGHRSRRCLECNREDNRAWQAKERERLASLRTTRGVG